MKNFIVSLLVIATALSFSRLPLANNPISAPIVHADANPGSIWTTNVSCGGVNINLFANKADVYLNGGPNGGSPNGLPDGNYFVKVTDPSGATLLGHVSASGAVVVSGGHFAVCYNLYALTEFTDSPNNGDEYKVWVSQTADFNNGENKTDNFKVGATPSTSPSVSPSASPSVSPSASPSVSPSASPSVSPSASPTPASSATPTPTNNDGGSGDGLSSCPECTKAPQSDGAVLGAYAETGVAEDVIMNALGSLGGLMTAAGSVLYGKKRSKK